MSHPPTSRSLRPLTAVVALAGIAGLTLAGCARPANGSPHVQAKPAVLRVAGDAALSRATVSGAPTAQPGGPNGLSAADVAAMRAPRAHEAAAVAPPESDAGASGLAASGIPSVALDAYKRAATREAARAPSSGLTWPLLAGIGRVESDHGRFAGAVLHVDGRSTPPVIGIALDGKGTAVIRDTDGGRLDGDKVYDRAVGPMQFIPSTWAGWGVDNNGDGVRDPFNIYDAAAAAADYLCAAGRDLTTAPGQVRAILTYNQSLDYVKAVMGVEKIYAAGVGVTVPVLPATGPAGSPAPNIPPADPGKPRGATTPGSAAAVSKPAASTVAATGSTSAATTPSGSAPSTGTSSSSTPTPTPTPTPTVTPTPTPTTTETAASDPTCSPDPAATTDPANPTTPAGDPSPTCPAPTPTSTDPSPTGP